MRFIYGMILISSLAFGSCPYVDCASTTTNKQNDVQGKINSEDGNIKDAIDSMETKYGDELNVSQINLDLVKKLRIVAQKKGVVLGEIDFYLNKIKKLREIDVKMDDN